MPAPSPLYRAAVRLATALVPLAGLADPKIRRGHAGRRDAVGRFRRWASQHRDLTRPLVWIHAPSVGEGLQAESVLRALRGRRPDLQIGYTHFSPSAEPLARRIGADVADYLPYDRPGTAEALLDTLRPALLVFAKLDLWPELAAAAARRGIPVALVAATVAPGSGRLRWPARALLRPGYEAVAAAGAVAGPDAARLERLGVARDRIRVTGDPRHDSVLARVAAVDPGDPLLALGRGAPALVAGSTWPADEAVLLDAFERVRRTHPAARLVLVPHEPTPGHLGGAVAGARRRALPDPVRLAAATPADPLVLVDRVGVLAALYGAGAAAYVGGGFGRAGLHSVLEPAAWGVPVAFGPAWRDSRDAAALLDAGAATALPAADAAGRLAAWWREWLDDERARRARGGLARALVESGAGASERSAGLLAELLPPA